ncbi:MAG: glyoxalase/bleomycin resistance protein/dioxygenase [Ferruginibacter sp.]|uniref:VOC family protein n=1 Tax=Ferruginibacter sp. TaxID=1940288 RepID=UPI00265A13BF|nr:VOC family protein [Ferruginibacter sp.]MDB5277457.1 glyoxalase/bleomycin resistance protein/dioxygenase [Ferruginibacter sp.]
MKAVTTTIEPWLSVINSGKAVAFYKLAFEAAELFKMEAPDGSLVAQLAIGGASFWVSDESQEHGNFSPQTLGGKGTVRIILTVTDPDALFAQALAAGATQVSTIAEEYGWRVGRVVDPFGHHWEIGRPVDSTDN